MFQLWMWIMFLVLGVGCGSDPNPPGDLNAEGSLGVGNGVIKLAVTNSRSFNPNIAPGQIQEYTVIVSGEGFTPIEKKFSGEVVQGRIEGIPTGKDLTVTVQAINPNKRVIREGIQDRVRVAGGKETPVTIPMQSVPVVVNIEDGATVNNNRLVFKIFSDPGRPVYLEEGEKFIADNVPEEEGDLVGVATIVPPLFSLGVHQFTVRDPQTGKFSKISVELRDGYKQKAAALFSAARAADERGLIVTSRLGEVWHKERMRDDLMKTTFADIVEAFWK